MKSILCGKRYVVVIILVATLFASGARAGDTVRESILAGSWYSGNAAALRESVRRCMDHAAGAGAVSGRLIGLIAPHAGHACSGVVAGKAYAVLERHPAETVIVLAPSHHQMFEGVSAYEQGGYQTPLGVMEIDKEVVSLLRQEYGQLQFLPQAHEREHAVEIQVPFLQVALPEAKLVPLIMGRQGLQPALELGKALAAAVRHASGKRIVLVASTDLSHYHGKEECGKMDAHIREAVLGLNYEAIARCMADGSCEACGAGPLIAVLYASKLLGADHAEVLAMGDSGDTCGGADKVVGYMAAALFQQDVQDASAALQDGDRDVNAEFNEQERAFLHELARNAIRSELFGEDFMEPENVSGHLREERGVFVTLKREGRLRGCIGYIVGTMPLVEAVTEMAKSAAFRDPRFPPVGKDEFDSLEYEISVLTPLRRIANSGEVIVGRHGLLMKRGIRQGLLLPQVAVEYGWNREQFLDHTCEKSRMEPGCWKDPDTEIYVFSAEVF